MKTLKFKNQVAKIYTDEENGIVFIEWLSPVLQMEYKQTMEELMKISSERKLTKFVADVRLLGALSDDSIQYSNDVVMPVMGNMDKIAAILPQEFFDKMIADSMLEKFSDNRSVSFSNMEEAEAWIKQP